MFRTWCQPRSGKTSDVLGGSSLNWPLRCQVSSENIKTVISQAPVPRFYSLQDEVTLQCDASHTGLGAALLWLQQPVSFASRALTQTETRYAQIEKELLAIVFACGSLKSTSLSVMWRQIISLKKKSLRAAFGMLRQGFSGCYCVFKATISRSATRKVPSC